MPKHLLARPQYMLMVLWSLVVDSAPRVNSSCRGGCICTDEDSTRLIPSLIFPLYSRLSVALLDQGGGSIGISSLRSVMDIVGDVREIYYCFEVRRGRS